MYLCVYIYIHVYLYIYICSAITYVKSLHNYLTITSMIQCCVMLFIPRKPQNKMAGYEPPHARNLSRIGACPREHSADSQGALLHSLR